MRRGPHKRKAASPLRFSKKLIVIMFLSMGVFTVGMTAIYLVTGGIPDTLVAEFFGFFGLEGSALGIIKVAETIAELKLKKKGKEHEGSMEQDFDQADIP